MVKNLFTMRTRDRLRLVVLVTLLVALMLLWPMLFSAKLAGDITSSWVALWAPLWVLDSLGEEEALGRGDMRNDKVGMGGRVRLSLVCCLRSCGVTKRLNENAFIVYIEGFCLFFVTSYYRINADFLLWTWDRTKCQRLWAGFICWGTILTVASHDRDENET